MKNTYYLRWFFAIIIFAGFALQSCQDNKMQKYYEEPDWLKGSICEVLADRGEYSIFLKGIELAEFTPMVNGKSILTVMAPNDDAFTKYLNETYGQGTKIEDLEKGEVSKLIGFHLCIMLSAKRCLRTSDLMKVTELQRKSLTPWRECIINTAQKVTIL